MRGLLPFLSLAICLLPSGCQKPQGDGVTRIVLVTMGGLAHPRHGGREVMESWGQKGLRFSQASAASNWVAPSVASLLTGRNPRAHGLINLEGASCSSKCPTLPEVLAEADWTCHAVLGDSFLMEPRGLDRGFETWEFLGAGSGPDSAVDQAVLDSGLDHLRATSGPCFLWLHLAGPRPPYSAPDGWPADRLMQPGQSLTHLLKLQSQADPAGREDLIALHLHDQNSLLESVDQWLGLLDKETLVAFVGSSGFELGEQGRLGSGTSMGEEALAVPFMLLGPGIPVGQVQRRVGHVDLMPTLLDLAGLPEPRDLAGVSILPGRSAAWRPLFSSTRRAHSRDVVYEEGLKLLRDGETGDCSLYDLDRDPDELMEHGTRLGSDRTRLRQVLLDHLERP